MVLMVKGTCEGAREDVRGSIRGALTVREWYVSRTWLLRSGTWMTRDGFVDVCVI